MLIPLLFMGDVVGRLFREFAITLAVAILISAVVSLTLTPMMCARLLRTRRPRSRAVLPATGDAFDRVIARYGRALDWVLDRQPATLVVAIATLVLTVAAVHRDARRASSRCRTPASIQGISEAPQIVSFAAMAERQQALARAVLQDPAVESLSSFIGVDGTNTTLNSGRMLINLKPLDAARRDARRRDPAAAARSSPRSPGIALYMQPVQDLTIEDRVSRTQYQFTLEAPIAAQLAEWTPRLVERLRAAAASSPTSPATCRTRGCRRTSRSTATPPARLGITPAAIDNALYNAFGQRLVSTIFTQANQYRVVLEVKPEFQRGPGRARRHLRRRAHRRHSRCRSTSIARVDRAAAPLAINHIGQFPAATISFNLAPRRLARRGGDGDRGGASASSACRASVQTGFQGAALAFRASLAQRAAADPRRDRRRCTSCWACSTRATSTRSRSSRRCPRPASARCSRCSSRGNDLGIIAIIGIILLIGIVKKNAIMMIDFALDAERERGQARRARRSTRRACCASGRS